MTPGAPWARCFARALRNCPVSSDHLPPTSAARTTKRARPPAPFNSRYVLSLRLLASWKRKSPASLCRPCAHHGGVQSELGTVKQRQPVGDDLQTSTVHGCVRTRDVKVPHHDVRGHTPARFSAHLRCAALQSKPTPPQHPRFSASCAMMAKRVKKTATSASTRRHQHTEWLRVKPCDPVGGDSHEDGGCQRSLVRKPQCTLRL